MNERSGEARVEINGARLNTAQSMALRVACARLLDDIGCDPDVLGSDEHGRHMADTYRTSAREILAMITSRV
ncbi:MAG: hypothetical protein EA385_15095 [Salinarimonadaceae bacterium]|nr:MAG: hypothetical protein EA385_15095 [Salinarimonadaceae bacterium]